MNPSTAKTIDDYIASFPQDIQATLEKIRVVIRNAAPGVTEAIKYDMPTFMLEGNLVYFAVYKKHIGLYPRPNVSEDEAFKQELSAYAGAKSSVRFPLDKPVPYDLIEKLVKVRVQENLERAAAKRQKKGNAA